jgi:hypothetical protein
MNILHPSASCLAYSLVLKREAICFSEPWVDFHWTTWCYVSEDRNLHSQCFENLKSNIFRAGWRWKQYENLRFPLRLDFPLYLMWWKLYVIYALPNWLAWFELCLVHRLFWPMFFMDSLSVCKQMPAQYLAEALNVMKYLYLYFNSINPYWLPKPSNIAHIT